MLLRQLAPHLTMEQLARAADVRDLGALRDLAATFAQPA